MNEKDLIGARRDTVVSPPHAAATATEKYTIWEAPYACRLMKVIYESAVAITGVATNYTNVNCGTVAGTTATEKSNRDYLNATNEAAYTPRAHYAPAGGQALAAGDRVYVEIEKVGSGLDIPALRWTVEYDTGLTS